MMMKYILILLVSVGYLSAQGEISIVVSPSCSMVKLTKEEVKLVFLKKKKYIHDRFVVVLDNKNKKLYEAFVNKYLDKSIKSIRAYWMRMLFTGKKIPPEILQVGNVYQYKGKMCYMSYVYQNSHLKDWKVVDIQ